MSSQKDLSQHMHPWGIISILCKRGGKGSLNHYVIPKIAFVYLQGLHKDFKTRGAIALGVSFTVTMQICFD